MILDERLKEDEIEKRKIILENAKKFAEEVKKKGRDETCSEAMKYSSSDRIDPNYRSFTIDTGDGKEKYYTTVSDKGALDYRNYNPNENSDKIGFPQVQISVNDARVAVNFRADDKNSRSYILNEEEEYLYGSKNNLSKAEGDTFIERLVSIEDEYCSQFEPELAEKYKECFNTLKGMIQPFVVQDLHHETEEAKYRREIKEKIENLEKELAEKQKELEAEKDAHEETRGELKSSKGAFERLSERYEGLTSFSEKRESELRTEKKEHDKTKLELYNEKQAHSKTKSDLEKEKEEHGKTKQFLSALGESVKVAASSKLPKTGKAFFSDIKEKYSSIVRGKGLPEKDDVLTK